jgi:hypothetical protein
VRAVFKIAIDIFAAIPARLGIFRLLLLEIRSRPTNGLFAPIAYDERLPLFDSEYRNKKQAQIVVGALVICLMQAANWASAWILIQNFYFG